MRLNIEEVKHRDYWTPCEAGRVLGHGDGTMWAKLFDDGIIAGHVTEGNHRKLLASSCRAYLSVLDQDRRDRVRRESEQERKRLRARRMSFVTGELGDRNENAPAGR